MKTRRSRVGLSILAGGLSFVGSASAVDLIQNGSFESVIGGTPGGAGAGARQNATMTGWNGVVSTYNYSTPYFTGPAVPSLESPGSFHSWRHGSAANAWDSFVTPTNELDHLQFNLQFAFSRTVDLTNALSGAAIDSGAGQYSFSAWLASYGQPTQNPEQPYLVLRFFDDTGTNQIASNTIFDRVNNVNAVMYADGNTSIPADLSTDHNWIKYVSSGTVPATARKATVYITRSPNAAKSNTPDTYVDLVRLDVINVNDTTVLDTAFPADGQNNVSPDAALLVTLRDVNSTVNTDSIQLSFDGAAVAPTIEKAGALTHVRYDPPGLLPPFVTHNYRIVWSNSGSPVVTKTNQFSFTVVPYVNIVRGAPIHLETFDGLTEGSLPTGWSVQHFTDSDIPGYNLNDFRSDAYLNWVAISRSTLSNLFGVVPGGGDFPMVLNVAPYQAIDGNLVTNLIDGNFFFAVSDRADNEKQVQYLFTRDYNLSGRTNVYLSFNSAWTQNQDSMAAVEYSLNGGSTWLPAQYMLAGADVLRDTTGLLNASNTFAAIHDDVPNLEMLSLGGGNYGQFIGVHSNQWANLGPFISPRVDDDHSGSKRVEVIRLAQADNQPAVRLRFANMGTWSWYWAIDDLGFYSITTVARPVLLSGPAPAAQTAAVGNSASFTIAAPLGLGPFSYQWRHDGTNLPGQTSDTLVFGVVRPTNGGTYDVVVSNGGGSATSTPPAVLTVINPPVFITGQWDFPGNLSATVGRDLEYFDTTVAANTVFGTTTSFGIPDINGQPTSVMRFSPSPGAWGGYLAHHGAQPNGGGAYVNQYTVVYDVYYNFGGSWRSLWQTATNNSNDGDFFISDTDGIGISSVYNGSVTAAVWHRIAIAFDLGGPGPAPILTKFIDGVKVGQQTTGIDVRDGRFSLGPSALLFADESGDQAETFVSSVQISDGRRPDEFLAALGGPNARKIPGVISGKLEAGQVVIRWTGGVPLESATSVTGPWTTVTGATSPYTVPNPGAAGFYRPKIL